MPDSDASGFSTASKQAIALITAEMARKDDERVSELAKTDAEMNKIKLQMAEMAKLIQNIQVAPTAPIVAATATRGRGRGRGQDTMRGTKN